MEQAKELNTLATPGQTQPTQRPVNVNANIPGANMNGTSMTGGAAAI